MTDPTDIPPQTDQADAPADPTPDPVKVAWVAGPETLRRLGRILAPLAVGSMDEVVDVLALVPDAEQAPELPTPPVTVYQYRRGKVLPGWSKVLDELQPVIRDSGVRLLHALDGSALPLTRRLAGELGLGYVLSVYDMDTARGGRLGQDCRAVLAGSVPVEKSLVDHRVAPPSRVRTVRPGLVQVRHATCFQDRGTTPAILAGGSGRDAKPYEVLISAFKTVLDAGQSCALFVVVQGQAERRIRLFAEKLGLNGEVTFVDRPGGRQLAGLLQAADLYVSPTPMHEVDIDALLAMAAGDPVIAARSSVSDFIRPDETVLAYDPTQPAELAEALTGLLADRAQARAQAEAALAYVQENHSASGMIAEVAQAYRRAVRLPANGGKGAGKQGRPGA